jgi:hypothetical protein
VELNEENTEEKKQSSASYRSPTEDKGTEDKENNVGALPNLIIYENEENALLFVEVKNSKANDSNSMFLRLFLNYIYSHISFYIKCFHLVLVENVHLMIVMIYLVQEDVLIHQTKSPMLITK